MRHLRTGFIDILASIRLTLALLFILAVLGIIGTFVPQEKPDEVFGGQKILYHLQMYDIFHSYIFYFVMVMLSINIIFCSLTRLPQAWRRFRGDQVQVKFKIREEIRLPLEVEDIKSKVTSLLKKRLYKTPPAPQATEVEGKAGLSSYLGPYIVHAGVLVLIAGTFLSSVFGIEGYANIGEGETINRIETGKKMGQTYTLPFEIHLKKFTVEFYENGMPKQYRSDLEIIKDDRRSIQAALMVNHPIEVEGFRIYQASYGEKTGGEAKLGIFVKSEKVGEIKVKEGQKFPLPREEKTRVLVLRTENNLMHMGPAVKLSIQSDRGEFVFWVFKHIEKILASHPGILEEFKMLNPRLYSPYHFILEEFQSNYYSGLQVKRDPGALLVGVAAIIIVFGLVVTYFISPRTLKICWEKDEHLWRVSIEGTAARDISTLKRDVSYLIGKLVT
ncbi:MAG: cytochrome c biogenesis protein ResB [Syntrophales bacterium]|nr:cytochrome c biogenesis protein ResB [Syntrophales bacterium]